MKDRNNLKDKCLHIRVSGKEWQKIHRHFSQTDHSRISTYAREILLRKPVVGSCRNRSTEDLITELIRLRKEMNHIGNNFNQAVHKLHTADNIREMKSWILEAESDRKRVVKCLEAVQEFILSISKKWWPS